ncbi:hypothetical protein [Niabella aquatica]
MKSTLTLGDLSQLIDKELRCIAENKLKQQIDITIKSGDTLLEYENISIAELPAKLETLKKQFEDELILWKGVQTHAWENEVLQNRANLIKQKSNDYYNNDPGE